MRILLLAALVALSAGCTAPEAAVREPPQDQLPTAPTGGDATPATTPTPAPPPPPPADGSPRQLNVTVAESLFSPRDVTVPVGATVTWTNLDPRAHSIVLDADADRRAGPFAQNGTAALAFDEVGVFAYHCDIHPSMKGVVRVEVLDPPAPPPPPPPTVHNVTIAGNGYHPGVLRVSVGSEVVWTNTDYEWHEVEANAGPVFASGLMSNGQSFRASFPKPATYTYRCDLHQMSGTIIVE